MSAGITSNAEEPFSVSALYGSVSTKDVIVIYATAAFSVGVFFLFTIRSFLYRISPVWLRPFAPEETSDHVGRRSWSHWTLLLALIALAGLTLAVFPVILGGKHAHGFVDVIPWLCVMLITAIDPPVKTPKTLLLLYVTIITANVAIYSIRFLDHTIRDLDVFRLCRLGLSFLAFYVIGSMPFRDPSWGAKDIGRKGTVPSHNLRSPEDNLSLFKFWTMAWVSPLARLGRTREVTDEDVWQLPIEFQHTRLYMAFRELEGRILPCLIEANGLDLFISILFDVAGMVIEVSAIRLSSKLYAALDRNDSDEALFWCSVALCLDVIQQITVISAAWYSRKAYERSRGETFIALFCKLLTRAVSGSDTTERGPEQDHDDVLMGVARPPSKLQRMVSWMRGSRKVAVEAKVLDQQASNAKVVNLVRGDTYEISQVFWNVSRLVAQPIKIVVSVYYLIDIMGWSSAVGFGLMFLFLSINSLLVKQVITLERSRTAYSDKRAQAVSHFVEASRPLKLNGWTASWSDRIMKFRDLEMVKRLEMSYVQATISTVGVAGGAVYPLASIYLYTVVLRQGLPNNVIWPSLQLFSQLERSVKEAFDLISACWKATIPVERVNKYMDEPDRDDDCASGRAHKDIVFQDASFSWPSTDKIVLANLDLKFSPGLTIIRGKVGSGKSSLLLAALNEMELHSGVLTRPDCPIAYAQQLPWLQSKTIRENILFHHEYDPIRYRQTLHVCALGYDLATFPDGDQTKLEEGGIGLSGGQKARVALARAIYSQSPILLLDDPLAALDHDTATMIVRRFLQGALSKDRTIVMVTHRDELVLQIADQVIDMDCGRASVLTREQIQRELEQPHHGSMRKPRPNDVETIHDAPSEDALECKEPPEEAGVTGQISFSVYTKYMKAGGWTMWLLLALSYGTSRFFDISRARLLEAWGAQSAGTDGSHNPFWNLPDATEHPKVWLYVLAGVSAGQIIAYAIAQVLLARIGINAARGLFRAAVDKVGKATFRYHDTTPTGQLKNRLISDMAMVDGGIVAPLELFVYNLIALIMSVIAIATQEPMLLVVLAFVALLFVYFFRTYVPISRCLRRLEMRYLTPIIANIGVMQDGLVTIRALRVEKHFQDRHLEAVDDFQKQDHFFWSMAFWLNWRLSTTSATMRAAMIFFMIWMGTPASAIGFVLTQTTIAMASVQTLCERFAQLQLDAVSLERVNQLNHIAEEPKGDDEPPEDWPRPCDAVRFEDVSFKYDDDLPTVLDKVSFEIPGGSTCAVLGRTGSGKSTIANALLVTQIPSEGSIKIGSVDLSRVDRMALRNRITFIQQDPTLFPGTLRDNIDPEGRFPNTACLSAIHRVLGPEFDLDTQIDAAGKNLSQGQRQLVGIARAVLRRSGLVILDEATASIDRATAATVQRILRDELASSTVITIAHRIEAVEDADWCLMLDRGKVAECGPAGNWGKGGQRLVDEA